MFGGVTIHVLEELVLRLGPKLSENARSFRVGRHLHNFDDEVATGRRATSLTGGQVHFEFLQNIDRNGSGQIV